MVQKSSSPKTIIEFDGNLKGVEVDVNKKDGKLQRNFKQNIIIKTQLIFQK